MNLLDLDAIQSRLQPRCHLYLRHQLGRCWTAGIETEGNTSPHWIEYAGDTPDAALAKLKGYLRGRVKDHARQKRKPSLFLRESLPAVTPSEQIDTSITAFSHLFEREAI